MDDQVRELLQRLTERVREVFLEILAEVRRLTAPLLAMWARMAIHRWEQVQRVFAEHRDLVETDGWLDRWYSFGTA